jgi:hypothetical protein
VKTTPLIVPPYDVNHGLSIVIESPVRETVMSRSLKTTPVKLSRCDRTQQLSAPVTDTKRCVTVQLVLDEAGGAFDVVGAVGEDCEEEELPPPHAVKITAAVVSRMSLIAWPLSGQCGHSRLTGRATPHELTSQSLSTVQPDICHESVVRVIRKSAIEWRKGHQAGAYGFSFHKPNVTPAVSSNASAFRCCSWIPEAVVIVSLGRATR